jgi:hypothetical protein
MELLYKEVFKCNKPKCLLFQTNKPILSEITNITKISTTKPDLPQAPKGIGTNGRNQLD